MMGKEEVGFATNGQLMHYSVGAIIKRDNKYLLIDRQKEPFGMAGIAGHVDMGEDEITALYREVREEAGLFVNKHEMLLKEEVFNNICSKGVDVHYWYLFQCEVLGNIIWNEGETKSIGWYKEEEIQHFYVVNRLEPVWEYWFKKLRIIS